MEARTSVTLPKDLLDSIDRVDRNRSGFLEHAARTYLARLQKELREQEDRRADQLNKDALDVLDYQTLT